MALTLRNNEGEKEEKEIQCKENDTYTRVHQGYLLGEIDKRFPLRRKGNECFLDERILHSCGTGTACRTPTSTAQSLPDRARLAVSEALYAA